LDGQASAGSVLALEQKSKRLPYTGGEMLLDYEFSGTGLRRSQDFLTRPAPPARLQDPVTRSLHECRSRSSQALSSMMLYAWSQGPVSTTSRTSTRSWTAFVVLWGSMGSLNASTQTCEKSSIGSRKIVSIWS